MLGRKVKRRASPSKSRHVRSLLILLASRLTAPPAPLDFSSHPVQSNKPVLSSSAAAMRPFEAILALSALTPAQSVQTNGTIQGYGRPTMTRSISSLPSATRSLHVASIVSALVTVSSLPASSLLPTSTQLPAGCSISTTDMCPACDQQNIVDNFNVTYRVDCNVQLLSNRTYYPQQWLTPAGCIAMCSDYEWCRGATYQGPRDCGLARGSNISEVSASGYSAFVPIRTAVAASKSVTTSVSIPTLSTIPSQPSMTSSTTIATPTSNTSSTTVSPTVTPLPDGSMCDVESVTCPACNTTHITDKLKQRYRILCGFTPDCENLVPVGAGAFGQERCLESCDSDVTCFAVQWSTTNCNLCQRTFISATDASDDSILFLAQPPFDGK